MAGWRQAVALAMTGEEIEALTALFGPPCENPKNKRKRRAFLRLVVASRQRLNSARDVVFAGNPDD